VLIRARVVSALRTAAVALQADRVVRPFLRGNGAILMFHRVRPRDPALIAASNHGNSIAPALFATLLDALGAAGIDVVDLDEAQARLARQARPFVCLTFDDGYRDNFDTVLPIATARKLPVTVFVAPGLIDGTAPLWWYGLDQAVARERAVKLGSLALPTRTAAEKAAAYELVARRILHDPSACAPIAAVLARDYGVDFAALAAAHMMSWAMVREMAASGAATIGAHTLNHPALARLPSGDAAQEIAGSQTRLEQETGRPVRHFAYPFGTAQAAGPREAALAREAGFSTAVTTRPGNLTAAHCASSHALPRYGIGPACSPALLRMKLSGFSLPG